jgi:regulator of cell morphogenesis and NO signaling
MMKQQEDTIFPYIKQVSKLYNSKEPFGGLFTRTLRKPVEKVLDAENELIVDTLSRWRRITNDYKSPDTICRGERVMMMKLRELDNDLVQHLHLEHNILLPKLLLMEEELNKQ